MEEMKKTEIVFVLDKSGSMHGMEDDTIGGFNSMIDKQKQDKGEAWVTTVLFNDDHIMVHDRIPLEKVREMTREDYRVGGGTALLDAVGNTINHIADVHHYIRQEDVPEKTIFVIVTDGMENASRRFNHQQIKQLVTEKEAAGWEFLFLGANIDAFAAARDIGVRADRAARYLNHKKGVATNFEVLGDCVNEARHGRNVEGDAWKERIAKHLISENGNKENERK